MTNHTTTNAPQEDQTEVEHPNTDPTNRKLDTTSPSPSTSSLSSSSSSSTDVTDSQARAAPQEPRDDDDDGEPTDESGSDSDEISTKNSALPQYDASLDPNTTRPPFTVKQLRDAIPAHCFERSAAHSFLVVARDFVMSAVLFGLALQIDKIDSLPIRIFLWANYMWWQGAVWFGTWICGHECGHGAFSESDAINDTMGLILHSFLLVPYHAWKISHANHHKNTGHVDHDVVYSPVKRSAVPAGLWSAPFYQSVAGVVLRTLLMVFTAWPTYLFVNLSGREYPNSDYPYRPNHFDPSSPVFLPKHRHLIQISNAGLVAMLSILAYASWQYTFLWVFKIYVVPYLLVHMWLVIVTALQHTDAKVPHYSDAEWTWLRGALCTVDRDFGIYNVLHHHITDTHVCHHIFPKIPFYHAQEATEALKKVLGPYYRSDNTPFPIALYRMMEECSYVNDEDNVVWYQKYSTEAWTQDQTKRQASVKKD